MDTNLLETSFRKFSYLLLVLCFLTINACHQHGEKLVISGAIEEPQNEIINTLVELINGQEHQHAILDIDEMATPNIDSMIAGVYDMMIIDNNATYHKDVTVMIPLYPQILHVLHKKSIKPNSIYELFENRKVYAGMNSSSSYKLVQDLLMDFQIDKSSVELVDALGLFDAEVIVLFSELISIQELVDLYDYEFYSLDDIDQLGLGTTAEAIAMHHPQFQPFILPSFIYGMRNKEPILTISNEAMLVCHRNLDENIVYNITKVIHENKQALFGISPLLNEAFDENYNISELMFPLHSGARNFLEREEPSWLEKYSGTIGILITLLIALMSGIFTLYNYRQLRKKDIIDTYYQQLLDIRNQMDSYLTPEQINEKIIYIKHLQNETMDLVIREKLSANESYLVYMKLAEMVTQELVEKEKNFLPNS